MEKCLRVLVYAYSILLVHYHDVMFVLWHRNNAGGLQAGGEYRKLQGQLGNDQKYSAQHIISGLT